MSDRARQSSHDSLTLRYDRSWAASQARHPRCSFLMFWGHRARPGQPVRESCFSQWFSSPFKHQGQRYATAEHWMMAGKARVFGDTAMERAIVASDDPREVKALGRKIKGFDATVWSRHKVGIVYEGNLAKFRAHPDMAAFLVKTDPKILVEASPVDPVWGIGLRRDDPNAERPEKWKGENLLGFCLMAVRDTLIAEGIKGRR